MSRGEEISVTVSQAILVVITISLYFLLFFLGNSYWQWVILSLLILIVAVVSLRSFFSKGNANKFELLIEKQPLVKYLFGTWVLALASWILSSITSHNVPLSLLRLTVELGAFALFWLVVWHQSIATKPDTNLRLARIFSQILILFAVILSTLSLFFLRFPLFASQLPSINLIHASFGHNHLASYLLLVLPLSWYWAEKAKQWLYFSIPLFLTAMLLLSFGRVAVMVGLFQLIMLWWANHNNDGFRQKVVKIILRKTLIIIPKKFLTWLKPTLTSHTAVKKNRLSFFLQSILVIVMIFVFLVKGYLSIATSISGMTACPFHSFRRQLCKPISMELRPEYWMQAWMGLKDYPLLGYGLGTFSLVSAKYTFVPATVSGFAHNSYFEMFSETGILGGFLFCLVLGLQFLIIFRQYANEREVLLKDSQSSSDDYFFSRAVVLSVSALFINAFFDFDWSFVSVYFSMILLTASIINVNHKYSSPNILKILRRDTGKLGKFFHYKILTAVLVIIMIFNSSQFIAIGLTELFILQKNYDQAVLMYPYYFYHHLLFSNKLEQGQLSQDSINTLLRVYDNYPNVIKKVLASQPNLHNWLDLASHWKEISPTQQYESDLMIQWLNDHASVQQIYSYYSQFVKDLEVRKKHQAYYQWFPIKIQTLDFVVDVGNELWQQKEYEQAANFYSLVVEIDPWYLGHRSFAFLPAKLEMPEVTGTTPEREKRVILEAQEYEQWLSSLSTMSADERKRLLSFTREMAMSGRHELGYHEHNFSQVYLELLRLELEVDLEGKQKIQMQEVTNDIKKIFSIADWKRFQLWEEISLMLQKQYSQKRADFEYKKQIVNAWYEVYSILSRDTNASTYDLNYQHKVLLVQALQDVALLALQERDYSTAVKYVKAMQVVDPLDYAVSSQLGHFYLSLNQRDAAVDAYTGCIDKYKQFLPEQEQFECQRGLEIIDKNDFWPERFEQVASIVLGLKTWDDI